MSKLKMTAIGNLGHDGSIRFLEGGTAAITFSLACTERYRDKAGNAVEKTTWVNCVIWRKADKVRIAEFLKRGNKVYVVGTPDVKAWKGKDGEPKCSLELRVEEIEFLDSKSKDGSAAANPAPAIEDKLQEVDVEGVVHNAVVVGTQDDDLPF